MAATRTGDAPLTGANAADLPRRRLLMLAGLFVTVVINYLDRTNISIAAIDMSRELRIDAVRMGLLFSAFAWSYSLCQIPGGLLADRVRPRVLYPALLALWSIATIVQGLAGSLIVLIVCRVLVGVFEAPSYPINNRVVTSWFPVNERAGAIGFYTSGQFIGLALLTPLLVWFQVEFGWRALFYACGGIGIVWAWIWHTLYRDPDTDHRLEQHQRDALEAGGAVVHWEGRQNVAKGFPKLTELQTALRYRKLWGLYLGQFSIGTVTIFFLTWFPTYLVENRGIPFERIGIMASLPFVAALCGVLLSGFASDWMVRRGWSDELARKGPVLIGIALSTTMLGALWAQSNAAMIAFMALAFFGNGMASITWVFVSLLAPPERIGAVGGMFNFIGGLSAAITPIAVGYLASEGDFSSALIYISAIAVTGVFAFTAMIGKLERVG